jgi:SAM-dependent methyltransferase
LEQSANAWNSSIHAVDPYSELSLHDYQPDVHGWGSEHEIFARVLGEIDARHILEIGSWQGASAIHMARLQQRLGRASEIVCVDTWLGALEFWLAHGDMHRYQALELCCGYPTVYFKFLRNVAASGFAPVITPFPITSAIAARFFTYHELAFDLIYVDGSHDYHDATGDLAAYWPLVRPGGLIFGDDYCREWPGVMQAVDDFAGALPTDAVRGPLEIRDEKWILRKPKGGLCPTSPT